MDYKERYMSISLRFSPEEWDRLLEAYEKLEDELGIGFSRHKYVKALVWSGMRAQNENDEQK